MKHNVVICMVCKDITDHNSTNPILSAIDVKNLILVAYFSKESIDLKKEICSNCKKFVPEDSWDKILNKI